MTAWTPPTTAVALATLTASKLNTELRDNMLYLKERTDVTGLLLGDGVQRPNVGSTETELSSTTIAAGRLATDGNSIRITVWGSAAANGDSKTLRLYLGGVNIVNFFSTTAGGVNWYSVLMITRLTATSQKIGGMGFFGAGSIAFHNTTSALDLGTALVLKTTGQGVINGDFIQEGFVAEIIG